MNLPLTALLPFLATINYMEAEGEARYPDFFLWITVVAGTAGFIYSVSLLVKAARGNADLDRGAREFERMMIPDLIGESPDEGLTGEGLPGISGAEPGSGGAAGATPTAATPLAVAIVGRLRATTFLDGIVGPFKSPDPDLIGTVIEVRGERVLILEKHPPANSEPLDMILRQYSGVIAPGPGPDPVFIRRVESWLGDFYEI